MLEKDSRSPDSTQENSCNKAGYPVFVPYVPEPQKYIVCDMCGHKNPEYTALCEMCSNYLKN